MPDVIGWLEEEAVARLTEAGFTVVKEYTGLAVTSRDGAERRVVRQRLLEPGRVGLVVALALSGKGGADHASPHH